MASNLAHGPQRKGVHKHEQVAARLSANEVTAIDRLVDAGSFLNRSDFLRSAAREKLQHIQTLEIREVDRSTAEAEILAYLRTHPDTYPSDVAGALKLDVALVMQICRSLLDSGAIREAGQA